MNIRIADRLVELRKKNGYSQEQLADKLGLSRQAVSKWERAEASPDTDNLICLAKLYGVSLDELLDTDQSVEEIAQETKEKEEEKKENHPQKKELTPREKKMNKILLAVSSSSVVLIALVYVLVGALTNIWHPTWILFLLIPVITSVVDAIKDKKLSHFCFPLLVTAIYLFLGCQFDLWHPYWFLFILIPVFYTLCGLLEKDDSKNEGEKENE